MTPDTPVLICSFKLSWGQKCKKRSTWLTDHFTDLCDKMMLCRLQYSTTCYKKNLGVVYLLLFALLQPEVQACTGHIDSCLYEIYMKCRMWSFREYIQQSGVTELLLSIGLTFLNILDSVFLLVCIIIQPELVFILESYFAVILIQKQICVVGIVFMLNYL